MGGGVVPPDSLHSNPPIGGGKVEFKRHTVDPIDMMESQTAGYHTDCCMGDWTKTDC